MYSSWLISSGSPCFSSRQVRNQIRLHIKSSKNQAPLELLVRVGILVIHCSPISTMARVFAVYVVSGYVHLLLLFISLFGSGRAHDQIGNSTTWVLSCLLHLGHWYLHSSSLYWGPVLSWSDGEDWGSCFALTAGSQYVLHLKLF